MRPGLSGGGGAPIGTHQFAFAGTRDGTQSGFLIVDARNAGNRYDLVVAGMVMIGVIGLLLDLGMRSLEQIKAFRWRSLED